MVDFACLKGSQFLRKTILLYVLIAKEMRTHSVICSGGRRNAILNFFCRMSLKYCGEIRDMVE